MGGQSYSQYSLVNEVFVPGQVCSPTTPTLSPMPNGMLNPSLGQISTGILVCGVTTGPYFCDLFKAENTWGAKRFNSNSNKIISG